MPIATVRPEKMTERPEVETATSRLRSGLSPRASCSRYRLTMNSE